MIVQLTGKVKYPITLDSSVWIFDDRKVLFDDAFTPRRAENEALKQEERLKKAAELYSLDMYQEKIKPPVNKNINKVEREQILKSTYVMPISEFVEHAEVESDATLAVLHTNKGDVEISVEQFAQSLMLFAVDGKPVEKNGPVHLYYEDGSNKNDPIKGIYKITIK